jgi:hypothetical protein
MVTCIVTSHPTPHTPHDVTAPPCKRVCWYPAAAGQLRPSLHPIAPEQRMRLTNPLCLHSPTDPDHLLLRATQRAPPLQPAPGVAL